MIDKVFKNIGIDSFGFYAPRFYLKLEDLAKKRNIDPNKFKNGLLLHQMRIPEPGEDIVTMSLNAAQNALIRGNINPKEIDALFLGTETVTYSVKSVSNILADFLGIAKNSITQDIYNACAGATLAVLNAIAMIENGIINKALVIGADISSYDLNSSGEPTQGAGAIAMIISKKPRIAVFSHNFGRISGNVNDFFRSVGDKNAKVFGKYSIQSYLNFQMDAYDDLIKKMGKLNADFYAFHAPFSKLPVKFLQKLIIERSEHFVNYILNNEPKIPRSRIYHKIPSIRYSLRHFPSLIAKKLVSNGYSRPVIEKILKKMRLFDVQFFQHLKVPMQFGNMYSASVWAQVNHILENFSQPNDVIYFGSYGSGATCISGLLKVMPNNSDVLLKKPRMDYYFSNKIRCNYDMYESMKLDNFKIPISIGQIIPHHYNKNRGIKLYFCDKGCIIPNYSGLDHCPQGHTGFHSIFYPTYALLKSGPNKDINIKNYFNLKDGYVRFIGKPEIGMELKYDMRRISLNIKDKNNISGLLNWAPTYMPTNKVLFR